ncbi:MAG TPA: His/Gly/Thr/Pro-type tRNA ligase C-terminal domain-containing protein [Candidatus Paceibacterota bacterium]|nr:His/Gly/Thr/Pro-type tRNA ligase C-terminal domain-containing protein [Candidatus Pacearchaeota archaeon]HRZ51004.1 His/Gly/Thr/Pro-type tRNA ligase C-terminal domain-containing protein [Candidatus Paceibacterota bacterium]HSA36725.1 His/Gly/Thr/Pro-type tRNA ligase C-terminal domain-containing protein [Candidatus Paceibacterota bacterium]
MKQSNLFSKTRKEAPNDEASASARFLIRGGFVEKIGAGIYAMLPLGLRVLNKIEKIIAQEMDAIGGQRILMTALMPKKNWETTGRWSSLDVLFKIEREKGESYALGATHEEEVVPLVQKFVYSYKDLPFSVYQIQTKFRDELRAKSGLLRLREFSMKDLYSFHADEAGLDVFYEKAKDAYFKVYERTGIKDKTFLTFASGGSFAKFSHEFQMITDAGEDIIHICKKCGLAINKEIKEEYPVCPECQCAEFEEKKAIEVGNIFKLKTKYSDPFNLQFTDKDGQKKLVIMGTYGIGLTRLMGAVAEAHHDESGIIWPREIAPFDVHLIALNSTDEAVYGKVKNAADKLYFDLQKAGLEVLYDDRAEKSAGEKFKDSDLLGIPSRIVVSEKTLQKDSVEQKNRNSKDQKLILLSEADPRNL